MEEEQLILICLGLFLSTRSLLLNSASNLLNSFYLQLPISCSDATPSDLAIMKM